MTEEELLGEVEDILRTMPPRSTLRNHNDENVAWLGRVSNFIAVWNLPGSVSLGLAISKFRNQGFRPSNVGLDEILTLLHQARYNLRMKTIGPVNTAIGQGEVFNYFDELRKLIETATRDLLFVDPYLDAEFVSRYLPHVTAGVSVRLLTGKLLSKLLSAVEPFVQQANIAVEVRSESGLHDRYVLIDQNACYQSGASFKDGAKKALTTLTQITDAFPAVQKTYEDLWKQAEVIWPQEPAR